MSTNRGDFFLVISFFYSITKKYLFYLELFKLLVYNIDVMQKNAYNKNVRYTIMFNFLLESGALDGSIVYIIMLVLIVGMFFFMSRSQKKKDKEAQDICRY